MERKRYRHRPKIHQGEPLRGKVGYTTFDDLLPWMNAHPGEYVVIRVSSLLDDQRAVFHQVERRLLEHELRTGASDPVIIFWDDTL